MREDYRGGMSHINPDFLTKMGMICGIVSIFTFIIIVPSILVGPMGIYYAINAKNNNGYDGSKKPLIALILSIIGTVLVLGWVLYTLIFWIL